MARVTMLKPALPVLGVTRTERKPWEQTHTAKRITGTTLQNLRKALFAREPLCRECAKTHRTTVATIRDHIIPLAEGGTDDESNIQPLCQTCSDAKTAEEAKRGLHRSRFGE